jgi:hypothetical protein
MYGCQLFRDELAYCKGDTKTLSVDGYGTFLRGNDLQALVVIEFSGGVGISRRAEGNAEEQTPQTPLGRIRTRLRVLRGQRCRF